MSALRLWGQRLATLATHRRQPGQALPVAVGAIALLVIFAFMAVRTSDHFGQVADLEAALGDAVRSGAQTLSYGDLVAGHATLRSEAEVAQLVRRHLAVNLRSVRGLVGDPAAVAQTAQVTVLPKGGTCGGQTSSAPLVCGRLTVTVSLLDRSAETWTFTRERVATLDRTP